MHATKTKVLMAMEEASRCLLCYDAPCSQACPAQTDPAKFIRSLRFRNLKGAMETIRTNNILGGICARVCPTEKYCEGACSRTAVGKPIRIAFLQQFLTDQEQEINFHVLHPQKPTQGKVAVIGSGPCGLAAAAELAQAGFTVTVFEAREKVGGWLTYGIPADRLPQAVVDREIQYVRDLGVTFKTGCRVGKDTSIVDLRKQGYKAILVAVGLQKSRLPTSKVSNLRASIRPPTSLDWLKQRPTNFTWVSVWSLLVGATSPLTVLRRRRTLEQPTLKWCIGAPWRKCRLPRRRKNASARSTSPSLPASSRRKL